MFSTDTATLNKRLAIRGISPEADPAFIKMIPWTRFTYAVSGVVVATATLLAFTPTLWMNAFFAALAVIMPHHLLEYIYNMVLRRWTRTAPLPVNGAPTRFAFAMMSVCLVATAVLFETGYPWMATGMGATIVFFATVVCVSHICVPALIYGVLTGNAGTAQRCAAAGTSPAN